MRSTWRLGKWRGVPIALHWTVLLGLPWFYYQTRSATAAAISFVGFLLLLMAHEIGHAVVAMWRGVRVRNIQLYFIHGLCTHDEPYHEEDDVLIAWGGVAAQLVVLVLAFGAGELLATLSPVAYHAAFPLFRVLTRANFVIMIVNLIPVAPLDGVKAWRALPLLREWARGTSWGTRLRELFAARKRARDRKHEAESARIAADIIAKLKKRKSDA